MEAMEAMGWVWAPPAEAPLFSPSLADCRARLEQRRSFFHRLLGCYEDAASTPEPAPTTTHLGSVASFFHVAGTNGKGSVCAILEGCLTSIPGKNVGVFTSPHLHTFRERIRVNGQLMDEDRVAPLVEKAKAVAGDAARWFNFFDKLFLLALLYFEEKKVDYVVLETGLGGRWDTTNVIEGSRLKVSIITSISKDHQEVLGDTLAQIAWEKAGIIKKGIPAVTMASQDPAALRVLEDEARLKETQLHVIDVINEEAVELLRPRLEGDTQRDNVTLAAAALGIWLRNEAPEQADARLAQLLAAGLSHKVYHPCRFEVFALPVAHAEEDSTTVPVVIDGGHNEDGLRRMFAYARKRFPGSRLVVVFGCGLYEKKLTECLGIVGEQADRIALVVSSHFKSAPVTVLRQRLRQREDGNEEARLAKELAVESESEKPPSVGDGIRAAIALATGAGAGATVAPWVVIVCGSLFVAADGRSFLASLMPFPPHDWVHHADHQLFVYK